MEPEFSELKVLFDLGLTLKQARVYLSLAGSGILKISEISKISKVARPDLYKTLSKLQQLGLVERIIQTPIAYGAVPIKEGLSLLLEKKRDKFKKVRAETLILLDKTKIKKPNNANQLVDYQFVLIPGRIATKRIGNAIQKAKKSVAFFLSWKKFTGIVTGIFSETPEKAWAKNVITRFIVESPFESETAKQIIFYCKKKRFCDVRFTCNSPKSSFIICDKKEVFMLINPKNSFRAVSALWSNNKSLIALAEEHFEEIWVKAEKNIFKIHG